MDLYANYLTPYKDMKWQINYLKNDLRFYIYKKYLNW
jgi:hypothetical protein